MAPDAWTVADAYEPYIGRWSRRLAPRFLAWAGVGGPVAAVDVGCGTGALSEALLRAGARQVAGVDLSPAYVQDAAARLGHDARAGFRVADAQALPFPDGGFDAAVSGLVLNFVPDPSRAVAEMARVTRTGGIVAAYVWDYAGGMEPIRRFWDAAIRLRPQDARQDEGRRFPLCDLGALLALFKAAGLREVVTTAVDEPTVFADFDDYWEPFLLGQGPAPGYCMGLSPADRERLRDELAASLPRDPQGRIPLVARAFAVRGRVP